jgi:peptidoglycan/xylan/chitin deacetylase (PgdA/CDA1 family)
MLEAADPQAQAPERTLFAPRLLRCLAPAGARGRLLVFIFHRVLAAEDALRPGEPDTHRFDRIVRFLTRQFRVLALADAADALVRDRLPAAAACITFDDGYADNLTLAAPILRRYRATATVFVATAYSDGSRMWNDSVIEAVRALPPGEVDWREFGLDVATVDDAASRRRLIATALPKLKYLPPDERAAVSDAIARRSAVPPAPPLMMSLEQLCAWCALGFDVGGHTVHHPILARLSDAAAADEIGAGREQLAQWLGAPPRAFAYPNGVPGRDYVARDVALVRRAGYACAVTTARGAASRGTDPYQLPRFTPWDRPMWAFGLRCAQTLMTARRTPAPAVAAQQQEACT